MYKLLIKDRQGNWQTADMGDDVPAMNFQINDIATLKDLNNNYSQTLKLPRTPTNCVLFEYADNFDILTDVPYSKHDCRLFSNDSVICGPGSILYLDKINDFFEVQIASGSAGLFETLQDKPMSELDLGFYLWGSQSMLDNYIEPIHERFAVPVATFLKGGATTLNTSAAHSYPFAYLKPAIEAILKYNEYNLPDGTLETNLTDEDWSTKAVNVCSMYQSSDSLSPFVGYADKTQPIAIAADVHFVSHSDYLLSVMFDSHWGIKWIAPDDCTVTMNIAFSVDGYVPRCSAWIKNYTTNVYELEVLSQTSTNSTVTFKANKGDVIFSRVLQAIGTVGAGNVTAQFTISNLICEAFPVGGNLHLSNNLGFDTQFDLFKAFVQCFGLTVRVDESTKTVSAYTMQKLYDNKTKKLDWSKKLNDIDRNTVFAIGSYGQTNTIKFSDNSDDVVTDSGSFIVSNAALPSSKELFTINFEAGKESVNYYTANIPIEEKAEDGTITFKGGKPHLVDIGLNPVTHDSWNARHVKAQSLIDTYYPKLVQMLTNAKMLTDVELWLTDQDIEDLDQFTPVWIEKYGCYFYVNKIKNFVSGKLTKCDLIKL